MTRDDRSWTAVIAECGLERARPVLSSLAPEPFARVDLAQALAQTGLILDRNTPFAAVLKPALAEALGPEMPAVMQALTDLPTDDALCPATVFWRARLRDLHGSHQPRLAPAALQDWTAFATTFRGRMSPGDVPDWLSGVMTGVEWLAKLRATVQRQRALPLSAQDRSLYARFGWNDAGDVPGMTGLLNAAALLRTQAAWALVAGRFDSDAQDEIEAAAGRLDAIHRSAAMATLDLDSRRLGVPRDRLAAALYPERPVPALSRILTEAA
jgi:hypothetical protein